MQKFPAPQDYEKDAPPDIPMAVVESSQIACIGHDPATETLAVQFKHGAGAIYHYPGVTAKQHAAFLAAESKGVFFKQHIKPLSFKKFTPLAREAKAEPAHA